MREKLIFHCYKIKELLSDEFICTEFQNFEKFLELGRNFGAEDGSTESFDNYNYTSVSSKSPSQRNITSKNGKMVNFQSKA